jgi:hypothetical protein
MKHFSHLSSLLEKQCLFTLLGPLGYPRLGIFVTKRQLGQKLYKKRTWKETFVFYTYIISTLRYCLMVKQGPISGVNSQSTMFSSKISPILIFGGALPFNLIPVTISSSKITLHVS